MRYNLYWEVDMETCFLCDLYCQAKPFWWRWFFGWRGYSHIHGNCFRLTEKQYKEILLYQELIHENNS